MKTKKDKYEGFKKQFKRLFDLSKDENQNIHYRSKISAWIEGMQTAALHIDVKLHDWCCDIMCGFIKE